VPQKSAPPELSKTSGIGLPTIIFAVLAIVTLTFAVYYIGRADVDTAAASALGGDLYILWRARGRGQEAPKGRRPSPLVLVVFVPVVGSLMLAEMGELGPPPEAVLGGILVLGFSVALLVSTFPLALAIGFKLGEKRTTSKGEWEPFVSILVPAYNEQEVISRTLDSLMNLNYRKKEIIIVDDGSSDLTASIASWYRESGVKVVSQPNSGKASALNHALLYAKGELIITVDSDSMVARDAVDEVVRLLEGHPGTVAVAGNIKVLNGKSILTRIQELEYVMALNTIRRAYAFFGSVMVIPGAFGAFRRSDVTAVGGYDKDTLTEDFDLTVKLLKGRGPVISSSSAVAYTEVPSTLRGLFRQRLRWSTGAFQTVYKHREVAVERRYGALHSIGFPVLMMSLLNPFVGLLAIGAGAILALSGPPWAYVEMAGIFLLAQFFVALVAISIDQEDYRLAAYAPLFVVGYRQLMDAITVLAALRTTLHREAAWNKLARSGGTDAIGILADRAS